MGKLNLTLAISDYDHVRDLTLGRVRAEGIELNSLDLTIEEVFFRFTKFREWDVSEMSMGKFVSLISQDDSNLTAIPVFPSRIFRQSSIYLHQNSGISRPEELVGKKVGIPEWAQTAGIYTRGYLAHQVGISLSDIDWYQAGVNQPGRVEKVPIQFPEGVRYTSVPERSLDSMLLAGEVDAIMTAHPPISFEEGNPEIVRLFPEFQPVEEAYWHQTGIFPIMHAVVIRSEIMERYPWVAMNLFKAFETAKQRSIRRALDVTAPRFPIPWCFDYATKARDLFGEDFWPYGIEPNRSTLEAFLQFSYEQGVCHRPVRVEELFPIEVQSVFKV